MGQLGNFYTILTPVASESTPKKPMGMGAAWHDSFQMVYITPPSSLAV